VKWATDKLVDQLVQGRWKREPARLRPLFVTQLLQTREEKACRCVLNPLKGDAVKLKLLGCFAGKVRLEAEFYRKGTRVLDFDVAGLDW
jgi:hypothetical protein